MNPPCILLLLPHDETPLTPLLPHDETPLTPLLQWMSFWRCTGRQRVATQSDSTTAGR
jgi:hypothetical protein